MRRGRFLVSPELLHERLMLPGDCAVTHLTYNHAKAMYELSVAGANEQLPLTAEGMEVLLVTPWYQEKDGVVSFAGWDWPHKGTTANFDEVK